MNSDTILCAIPALVERVDSGVTDESPFGSKLTTPTDEHVQLFSGIDARLLSKANHGSDMNHSIKVVETTDLLIEKATSTIEKKRWCCNEGS